MLREKHVRINPLDDGPFSSVVIHFLSYPIRAALRGGHEAVVSYLLQHDSSIEADPYERDGWTIIHDSILHRDLAMLAFLLDKKLGFPKREKHAGEQLGSAYEDALITAAHHDNYATFRMLLERGPIEAPVPLPLQQLLLPAACEGRSFSIARFIFDINPSLDPNYDLKETATRSSVQALTLRECPIEAAAHWGSLPLIELLLQHGIDPNWSSPGGRPALWRATACGYGRCKEMLLRAGAEADQVASP